MPSGQNGSWGSQNLKGQAASLGAGSASASGAGSALVTPVKNAAIAASRIVENCISLVWRVKLGIEEWAMRGKCWYLGTYMEMWVVLQRIIQGWGMGFVLFISFLPCTRVRQRKRFLTIPNILLSIQLRWRGICKGPFLPSWPLVTEWRCDQKASPPPWAVAGQSHPGKRYFRILRRSFSKERNALTFTDDASITQNWLIGQ